VHRRRNLQGAVRGHLNDSATHCITYAVDNTKICGVMLVDGATSPSQGGDSGGSVYSYNNQGAGVLAQGVVSGELTGSNGRQTVIVPISTLSGRAGDNGFNYWQLLPDLLLALGEEGAYPFRCFANQPTLRS